MMGTASFAERRKRLREIISRPGISSPASVFDPISARLAALSGHEYGLLGGSIAAHVVLGAPDLTLITMTELVQQCQRICRAIDLPIIVDADHGYGSALNVRRTVEELEMIGAAAITIEDTDLPRRSHSGSEGLISVEEFKGKLEAAVDARSDGNFLLIARTDCFSMGEAETGERTRAAAAANVDAIFFTGKSTRRLLELARNETSVPFILNDRNPPPHEELQELGVRMFYKGHQPFFVMLEGLRRAYGLNGSTDSLPPLSMETLNILLNRQSYDEWVERFLP